MHTQEPWYKIKDRDEAAAPNRWDEVLKPRNSPPVRKHSIFLGFDAFIDQILHVVDKRSSSTQFTAIQAIPDLAERIAKAAGKSANIELVLERSKLGGNSAIMGCSLGCLGQEVHYAGTIGVQGERRVDPLFQPLEEACHSIMNLGPASTSLALEFEDGKLILGLHENILRFELKQILSYQSVEAWHALFQRMEMVAFLNWTMTLTMDEMIRELLLNFKGDKKPKLFIDLADPAKRSKEDIKGLLGLLSQATKQGYQLILSVNESELIQLSDLVEVKDVGTLPYWEGLNSRTEALARAIGAHLVSVHILKGAFAYDLSLQRSCFVQGPYCQKPLITTGGGDHFNAGLSSGILMGLGLEESLALGCANSGFYVRHGHSPKWNQLWSWIMEQQQ
jgi:hypothetical protein